MSTIGPGKALVPLSEVDIAQAGDSRYQRLTRANVGGVDGWRNRAGNSRFDHWQRGASFSAAGQTADRFALYGTGTLAASRQALTYGEMASNANYYGRFGVSGHTAVSDYAQVVQTLEGASTLSGRRAVISLWARRTSGAGQVALEWFQSFNSGNTANNVSVPIGKFSPTATWQRYSLVFNVPSVVGKTFGPINTDFCGLALWLSAGSNYNTPSGNLGLQTQTVEFWGLQIEEQPGFDGPTPFEDRGAALELILASWYFQRRIGLLVHTNAAGGSNAGGTFYTNFEFMPMRVLPSASVPLIDYYANASALVLNSLTNGLVRYQANASSPGAANVSFTLDLSAEF